MTYRQQDQASSISRLILPQNGIQILSPSILMTPFEPISFFLSDRIVLIQNAMRKYRIRSFGNHQSLIKKLMHSFLILPSWARHPTGQNETIPISLRDLAGFLNNPAESTLRWHLGMYEDNNEDRAQNEIEPFFSVFPYSYRFLNDTLNFSIFNNSRHDIEAYMADYYRHARLKSATPPGAFGDVDYDRMKSIINEKLYGPLGISRFIDDRKNYHRYRNMRFGSAALTGKLRSFIGTCEISDNA